MLVKDQIRMRMDQLEISFKELATRVNTSEQTCRFWVAGRSHPSKKRVVALEKALSFKLDFSEGGRVQGPTVDATMEAADIELFIKLGKLPPTVRLLFEKLVDAYIQDRSVAAFSERRSEEAIAPFKKSIREVQGHAVTRIGRKVGAKAKQ